VPSKRGNAMHLSHTETYGSSKACASRIFADEL
jgi:hypothetical protein